MSFGQQLSRPKARNLLRTLGSYTSQVANCSQGIWNYLLDFTSLLRQSMCHLSPVPSRELSIRLSAGKDPALLPVLSLTPGLCLFQVSPFDVKEWLLWGLNPQTSWESLAGQCQWAALFLPLQTLSELEDCVFTMGGPLFWICVWIWEKIVRRKTVCTAAGNCIKIVYKNKA